MKDDVSDKDNTNEPNSRSEAREDELPGMNCDNRTSDLAEAGEIASQAFPVRRITTIKLYINSMKNFLQNHKLIS